MTQTNATNGELDDKTPQVMHFVNDHNIEFTYSFNGELDKLVKSISHSDKIFFQNEKGHLMVNETLLKAAIKSLLERRVREGRIAELTEANKWALSRNLNDASKHKWYRYHTDRLAELSQRESGKV